MVTVSGIIKETEMHMKDLSCSSPPPPPLPTFALGNSAIMHRVYASATAADDDDNMGLCV